MIKFHKFPNVFKLIRSLYTSFMAARAGQDPFATPELQEKRLAICKGCPFNLDDQCQVCTCYIPAKVMWSTEKCPLNPPKW